MSATTRSSVLRPIARITASSRELARKISQKRSRSGRAVWDDRERSRPVQALIPKHHVARLEWLRCESIELQPPRHAAEQLPAAPNQDGTHGELIFVDQSVLSEL